MPAGADVNQADMRGITPLGVAVGFNRIAIVEALLEAGADVEKPDGRGNTVLHYAAGELWWGLEQHLEDGLLQSIHDSITHRACGRQVPAASLSLSRGGTQYSTTQQVGSAGTCLVPSMWGKASGIHTFTLRQVSYGGA